MTAADRPWRAVRDGVTLRLRLTPRSSRDAIDGISSTADGPALKARVRAVPEHGSANDALEKLVAGWLGLPRSRVQLMTGGKSRIKTIGIVGDAAALEATLMHKTAGFDTAAKEDEG